MTPAQQKIHTLKSLVYDLEDSAQKRNCDKFIKRNFHSTELLSEETVNRLILNLRDVITSNNIGLRENLTVLAERTKKPGVLIRKLVSLIPFVRIAATIAGWFITNKTH